jgi:GST-like protein
MIDLYTSSTPNGRKISIALEEMGLAYDVHWVSLDKNEQFRPEFLAISPGNKIPAIVDRDNDLSIFESGAILMYLGDKTGMFYPTSLVARTRVHEWLIFQVSTVGPYLGRAHYFLRYHPGKAPFAEEWYQAEAHRIYGILDRRLDGREFLCDDYSIADIATFPWTARYARHNINLNDYPNVRRWYMAIAARPAVQNGFRVPDPRAPIPLPDEPRSAAGG